MRERLYSPRHELGRSGTWSGRRKCWPGDEGRVGGSLQGYAGWLISAGFRGVHMPLSAGVNPVIPAQCPSAGRMYQPCPPCSSRLKRTLPRRAAGRHQTVVNAPAGSAGRMDQGPADVTALAKRRRGRWSLQEFREFTQAPDSPASGSAGQIRPAGGDGHGTRRNGTGPSAARAAASGPPPTAWGPCRAWTRAGCSPRSNGSLAYRAGAISRAPARSWRAILLTGTQPHAYAPGTAGGAQPPLRHPLHRAQRADPADRCPLAAPRGDLHVRYRAGPAVRGGARLGLAAALARAFWSRPGRTAMTAAVTGHELVAVASHRGRDPAHRVPLLVGRRCEPSGTRPRGRCPG